MAGTIRRSVLPFAAVAVVVVSACGDRGETQTTTLGSTSDESASVGDATDPTGDPSDSQDTAEVTEDAASGMDGSSETSEAESDSVGGEGPMIVLLTATPPEITDDDIVTILAQVVDPDGAEDIVGGLLKSETGDATYGAFMQISEGSFSVVLDWNMIDAVEPITYSDEAVRTFLAEFTDTAANAANETVDVRFDCAGLAVCDGECTELGTAENCAACGDVCPIGEYCVDGGCDEAPSGCGDGAISPGEQCDGRDLQGFTCETLGLGGGTLGCDPEMCTFDTSNCIS